jgi:hypothetical protein
MEPEKQITDELITAVADGPNVLQSVDTENRIVEFIISSETVIEGRGYVVRQDGLDLSAIKKNPVFLWMHDAYGYTISGGMPVGKILTNTFRQVTITVDRKKVKATTVKVQFPTQEEFPLGHQVYKLYAAGYLNAVSIGFRVLQITEPTKQGEPREFTKWKLGELSGVAIGADDEALIIKRAQSLNRDESEAKQMFSELMVIQSKAIQETAKQDDGAQLAGHFMDIGEHTILVRTNDESEFQAFTQEMDKRSAWYEEMRPVMKQANKAMIAFFKQRGEKVPDDLEQAYIRMEQMIEEEADEPNNADPAHPIQKQVETPPAKPASKPGVVLSETALRIGQADIREQVMQAALKASAEGMSDERVKVLSESLYKQLFDEFISNFRSN